MINQKIMGNQKSQNIQKQISHLNKNERLSYLGNIKKLIQHRIQQQYLQLLNPNKQQVALSQKNKENLEIQPLKKHPMIQYQDKMAKIQEISKKRQSKYKDQYFECALCTQSFNVFDKIPMMVCMNQHTYCQQCIKQYFEKIKECPECRQPYNKKLIVKHRLLFHVLVDQDDDLVTRVTQREITLELEKLKLRNKYYKQEVSNIYEYKKINVSLKRIPCCGLQPNLLVLILDGNLITKIEFLDHLRQLKSLSLKYNLIEVIQNLQELIDLRFLFLQGNHISIIQNLNLVSIRQVYLQNNNIIKKENRKMIIYLREKGIDMHF